MKITYIRSSSLNCWQLCQMQFCLSYTLGFPQKTNHRAELGTCCHKILEILANCKKNTQLNLPIYEDEICGKIDVSSMFNQELIGRITKEVFEHYKNKSSNIFTNKDLTDISNWVAKTLEFGNGSFDPRKREIVEAEAPFNFEIEDRWAQYDYSEEDLGQLRLKGTIDLITKVKDNVYECIDWKTGRRINWANGEEKTLDKFRVDPQLLMYNYAMIKMYPEVKQFFPTIFYINDGGPFTVPLSRNDVAGTKLILKKTYEDIKNCTVPVLKGGGTHWFCKSVCSYLKSGDCKRIHEKITKEGIDKVVAEDTVIGHSVNYYQNPGV